MELYTLDWVYAKQYAIDEYISALWTERYADAGDFVLVVPPTAENRTRLAEGVFLANADSEEVMLIETQEIKSGELKVTGNTLDKFLNNRFVLPSTDPAQTTYVTDNLTAAQAICALVQRYAIEGGWLDLSGTVQGVNGHLQAITGLEILDTGSSADTPRQHQVPRGPLFDAIKELGTQFDIGWKMFPIAGAYPAYSIAFSSYVGRDLTSEQSLLPMVRFSAQTDSLSDITELRSIAGYKTVAFAIAPDFDPVDQITGGSAYTGIAYAYAGANLENDFLRRTMVIDVTGLTTDTVGDSQATFQAALDSAARNALANNNFTKVIDGEVVPQSEYTFGGDYYLGDIVELQDLSGFIQKARITEYIRSADKNGSRQYPTVSVIP